MFNALSVDVEEYFHVEAFSSCISPNQWNSFSSRVEGSVERVLALFSRYHARATFYVLGWVAERFPLLVRRIDAAGHEIGCHGFAHQRIGTQSRDQFRADIRNAREVLANEVQKDIRCYRAPSFSITRDTYWALAILAEEGFIIDSSIFPVRHDLYGIPDAPRFPYWQHGSNGCGIFEFPPSTVRVGNVNVGVGGGGYLRFAPYPVSRFALQHLNSAYKMPAMVYFHPWEFDPGQPRIPSKLRSRIRHYTNLSTMEKKVERLLQDFRFTTVSEASEQLEAYHSGIPQQSLGLRSAVV
jgi:polysaccharide deacetylase family protein (PEP-CTERM system associated)